MACPHDNITVDTRHDSNGLYQYRTRCLDCGHIFADWHY